MSGFYDKLNRLKRLVGQWNKDVFGNIFDDVDVAEAEATFDERAYDYNPSDVTKTAYQLRMAKLCLVQSRALLYWKQKENVKWMREGDANT